MANEIKDLNGFMEAVDAENNKIPYTSIQDELLLLHYRMTEILNDKITEADYINTWSEHGIS